MTAGSTLIYPRFSFLLAFGKRVRLFGLLLRILLIAGLSSLALYGMVVLLGRSGTGPFVELAARESDWMSVSLGVAACVFFAWLLWRSLNRQFKDAATESPLIEGCVSTVTEINESFEDRYAGPGVPPAASAAETDPTGQSDQVAALGRHSNDPCDLGGRGAAAQKGSGSRLAKQSRGNWSVILSRLIPGLESSALPSIVPGVSLNYPEKKDYWPEQWERMQHYAGAHIYEKIAGLELFYQLGFLRGSMISLQVNTGADFSESGYNSLVSIAQEIISANSIRGITLEETSSCMPWMEVKDQRLAESGLPGKNYIF